LPPTSKKKTENKTRELALAAGVPQRFLLEGEQEDARAFYLLERSLMLLSAYAEGAKRSQVQAGRERRLSSAHLQTLATVKILHTEGGKQ
jgi:hypothetical protein